MNVEYISPSHKQVLGYEPEELVKQWSIEFIHPDDREKIMQSIRGILAAGKHEAMEFRLRHADGHYLWLETVGSLILDDNGEKVGIVFSSRDITERIRSSQSLRDSEGKYREILDSIDDGYYEVDLAGRFNFFNDVLPRFLGYTHEELMSTNFKTAMDEENVKKVFEVFHQVYVTGVPSRLVEFESKRKDGSRAYVESSVFLIRNVEGTPVGFRGVVRDITERKQFQDRLQTMAITDQLTGLFNRRGFITLTEQQLKAADRTRKKVLLAFIDLDGMKHINDVWGHEEGDKALITAAKLLKQAFRESDIIARVGGDEFAVLAPDVADTMQDVFISRLRQQTDAHNLGEDGAYRLTMSVGSTFYDPNDPCSLDELMSRADRLMYEDKRRKVA
jgi:diguanylate cyclase (GGDEF)-like protein/PAS domain S-box-containing protein